MYNRADVPSEFQYPQGGLFPLRGMLTAKDINNPNNKNLEGSASAALSNADSRPLSPSARSPSSYPTYASTPSWAIMDSTEVAILPHDDDSGPFSQGGDSGSLIVGALLRFAALRLFTGGTGKTDNSDITFATLME